MTRRENNCGFTLIELIIVMVIVAVTVAISVPRLGSIFEATSFRRMVNKSIDFLRDARVDALSTGKKVSVVVDLDEFKLVRFSEEGEEERNVQMPDGVELEVVQEDKDRHKDEEVAFNFYPNGTASGPTLLLKDTGKGKNAVIYLEPLAGLVRYKVGNVE